MPFRPWADRLVIDLCLTEAWPPDAFETREGAVRLGKAGKRVLIPRLNVWLLEKADFEGRRAPRRMLIYQFAGALADRLKPFIP